MSKLRNLLAKLNKNQKVSMIKILIAALIYIPALVMHDSHPTPAVILFLVSYVIVGCDPIKSAIGNISRGQVFDENFLMTVATVGALLLRQWDEAVAVMLFYAVGDAFEAFAVGRSRESIAELMDIRPDFANRITDAGEERVDPYDIEVGDIIIIRPGERVPLDGTITDGASSLDTSALTGESLPLDVSLGDDIPSGSINMSGVLKVKVTSLFDDSTVARILDLVENSGSKKARVEKFITRFARYYTPAIAFSALALAILPPLILSQPFSIWIYRALLFLIISCPCALVISVPLAFFGGIGAASKDGILVKGSNYLEIMADVDTIVMDKTGTLTSGIFHVTDVVPAESAADGSEMTRSQLLGLAAHIEAWSNHPISASIRTAWGKGVNEEMVHDATEIAGKGLKAVIEDRIYYAGNDKLMHDLGITGYEQSEEKTLVHLACTGLVGQESDASYLGHIAISDRIKEDAPGALRRMRADGIKHSIMLTGDRDAIAAAVAGELGIDEYVSGLMPQDKVASVESILRSANGKVAFVGDGINDAPALAMADVGIAMGAMGQQAAIEAADIVIMDDNLSKISHIKRIAWQTLSIAKQNVIIALSIKFLILILGALGLANMWMAVFADVGVAVICILNSMRMLRFTS